MYAIIFFMSSLIVSGTVLCSQPFGHSEGPSRFGSPNISSDADLEKGNYQANDALFAHNDGAEKDEKLVQNIKNKYQSQCADFYLKAQINQLKLSDKQSYDALLASFSSPTQGASNGQPHPKDLELRMYKMIIQATQIESNEHKSKAKKQEQLAKSETKRANKIMWSSLFGAIVIVIASYSMISHQSCGN